MGECEEEGGGEKEREKRRKAKENEGGKEKKGKKTLSTRIRGRHTEWKTLRAKMRKKGIKRK